MSEAAKSVAGSTGQRPRPYPYLRIGYINREQGQRGQPESRMLQGVGTPVELADVDLLDAIKHGLDLVVVDASELRHEGILDTLIACEGAGIPTVLHAVRMEDLDRSVATVVSHIVTTDFAVHRAATAQVGRERALLVDPVVAPSETLMSETESAEGLSPEAISRRRTMIERQSPKAQADAFAEWLGFTVEPPPLVTAIIVSRKAENLDVTLANLRRQEYPRIDVLLTIDPLYEKKAHEATARWDIPVRIVCARTSSTLADRVNLGLAHAHGELVTVVEENALYGSHHITDLVQAIEYSGAHLVGKASWFVYDENKERLVARAPGLQRKFGEVPALGTMMLRRETAQNFGFVRRASGINWPLAERLTEAGGSIYSVHAFDTVLPRKAHHLEELFARVPDSGAFPFGSS